MKVPAAKLDLIVAWREAAIFTPREMAALAWTEHLAGMPIHHVPDEAYAALRAQFSETEATFLTIAIANINAWNRIAGSLRFAPPVPKEVMRRAMVDSTDNLDFLDREQDVAACYPLMQQLRRI